MFIVADPELDMVLVFIFQLYVCPIWCLVRLAQAFVDWPWGG